MSGALRREIAANLRFGTGSVVHACKTLMEVYARIEWRSSAGRAATSTTLAVVLAVLIACAMHLQEIWWAAISSYMCTRPQSIQLGLRRILGTIAGAVLVIISIGWLAYDPFACCLALFAVTVAGIIGFNVSPNSYGWLFVSITFSLVLLTCLLEPESAFFTGVHRIIEVVIGTCTGIAVAKVLPAGPAAASAVPRGWSDLLGSGLPITLHAIRSGVTTALIPIVWSAFAFELSSASQMAITATALQATPVTPDLRETHQQIVGRGLQRLLGCLVGGVLALAVLGLSFDFVLSWLIALAGGVWLFAYVQHGSHDATYVGAQAGIVFIMTLVQGEGPPTSIIPGIDRFAGISLGLLMMFVTIFLIGPPSPDSRSAETAQP